MFKIVQNKGDQVIPVTLGGKDIVIGASDILYTDAIMVPDHEKIALSYRIESDGIPNIFIFMEECHYEPKDNEEDDGCVVVEGGKAIVSGLIDKDQHHCLINPLPLKCFRFRIEQQSTTAPDSIVELIISCK